MLKLTLPLLLLLFTIPSFSQKLLTWESLSDVKFTLKFSEEIGLDATEATFGETVKSFENQQVIIRGYMIPLDPLGTQYVLSKHPMANCFFCGKAGPETVVELRLHPKSIRRYPMDEIHTFKGILRLNAKDPATLHYIIESAERM